MRKRKRNNDESNDKTSYRVQDDYANDEANTPVRSDIAYQNSAAFRSLLKTDQCNLLLPGKFVQRECGGGFFVGSGRRGVLTVQLLLRPSRKVFRGRARRVFRTHRLQHNRLFVRLLLRDAGLQTAHAAILLRFSHHFVHPHFYRLRRAF